MIVGGLGTINLAFETNERVQRETQTNLDNKFFIFSFFSEKVEYEQRE
ncbi:hypothetical protein GCM10008107_08140 [Psychrosphaera saromensis]|nr:hypothetical protein GCM10008107_08140 [Psychrosphaera saromensis]GLQ15317.1 hypothetical protein GCM10007917_27720 [Psychrosphaera saromensis]